MKAIITVIGKDDVGIIYRVTGLLAKYNVNILDISQTIMHGTFVAMLKVDVSNANEDFSTIVTGFDDLAKEIKVDIRIQNEELFDRMQRV